jgi:FkbM family methyltransferase
MRKIIVKFGYRLYVSIFAHRFWYRFNLDLYHLALRGLGILNIENDKLSGERCFLKKVLGNTRKLTIIDVGANVGNYALLAKSINTNAVIHAIEPMPNTYKRLNTNTQGIEGIKTYNIGMGKSKEQLTMYDYDDEGSEQASMYQEVITDFFNRQNVKQFNVEVIPLDEFCIAHQINTVNLLKIDTEGYEYNVLIGAKKMLAEKRIEVIHFEFNIMNVVSKVFLRDFLSLLNGYSLFRLLPSGVLPIKKYDPIQHELFAFQNIIAIRNDLTLFS